MSMVGFAQKIKCPVIVLDAEGDEYFGAEGHAKKPAGVACGSHREQGKASENDHEGCGGSTLPHRGSGKDESDII